jgi:rod shape-determining protein MreD
MTGLRVAAVCVVAIVLQLTVFVDVRISDVAPELLALVAVLAGLFAGPDRGPTVGFAAGLLWDIYLPTPLGVGAIVFAMAAYVVAVLVAGFMNAVLAPLAAPLVRWAVGAAHSTRPTTPLPVR